MRKFFFFSVLMLFFSCGGGLFYFGPPIPENVSVQTEGEGVGVYWDYNDDVLFFRIYRKVSGTDDNLLLIGTTSSHRYYDTSGFPDVEYSYFVSALTYELKESAMAESKSGAGYSVPEYTPDFNLASINNEDPYTTTTWLKVLSGTKPNISITWDSGENFNYKITSVTAYRNSSGVVLGKTVVSPSGSVNFVAETGSVFYVKIKLVFIGYNGGSAFNINITASV